MVADLTRGFMCFSRSLIESFSLARTWLRIEIGCCFSYYYIYTLIEMSKEIAERKKTAKKNKKNEKRTPPNCWNNQSTHVFIWKRRTTRFHHHHLLRVFFSLRFFPSLLRARALSSYRIIVAIQCILKHVNHIHTLKWIWQDRQIRSENRLSLFFSLFLRSCSLSLSTRTQSYEAS